MEPATNWTNGRRAGLLDGRLGRLVDYPGVVGTVRHVGRYAGVTLYTIMHGPDDDLWAGMALYSADQIEVEGGHRP